MNSSYSYYISSLANCWILFANILCQLFLSRIISEISQTVIFFFVLFLLVLGTNVVVISKKEFGIFISFSRFCNNLSNIGFSIP